MISKSVITLGAGALAVCATAQAAKQQSAKGVAKPNFIIILADDMGYGDLGCFGSTIKTPNLDRMAAEGLRFTDFHSNGSVSTPTRAALLTGRYQQRVGLEGVILENVPEHDSVGLPPGEVTFARVLKENGYATGAVGKWHLGSMAKYAPESFGFDLYKGTKGGNVDYHSHLTIKGEADWWDGPEPENAAGYSTDLINGYAVDFIRANRQRPFCLYVAHCCPHTPLMERNDPVLRVPGKKPPYPVTTPGRPKEEVYSLMITQMDEGIGKIFAALKENGLDNNTLVIFLSDNGPNLKVGVGSAGQFRDGKGSPFEGGHREPGIARMPGVIAPGSVCTATAIGMDIFPTMCEMAGVKAPANLDGVSIVALLKGGETAPRTLFWAMGADKAVREGKWKMVARADRVRAKEGVKWQVMLFDLEADPGEKNDVAASHPDVVKRLSDKLIAWEKDVRSGHPEQCHFNIPLFSSE